MQPPTPHAHSTVVAVRLRLHAVFGLALALALLAATASLLGSSRYISGTSSAAWTAASSDDDHSDLGNALPLLSFLLVALCLPLVILALPSEEQAEDFEGGSHHARAPPSG
jgi:H+/gluconate symporter-like permease